MGTYPVFPDAEAAVSGWLRDHLGGVGVYSSIPATPQYPLVTVARLGGTPAVRQYLDAARIDVNVWGTNKGEAHDIAQEARAALMDLEGKTVHYPAVDAFISGVQDAVGITWLPDTLTSRDRYVFSVIVYLRQADPGS